MKVSIKHISGSCKYHNKIGEEYSFRDCAPKGMCIHAYFAAYPYCLGLLYGCTFSWMKGKDKDSVVAQCPSPSCQAAIRIKREIVPELERSSDKDEEKYRIFIEVLERKENCGDKPAGCEDCAERMPIGKRFEFNRGSLGGICPAAFNQLFPYLCTLMNGGNLSWQQKDGSLLITCPDHINNVQFLVRVFEQ